MESTEFLKFWVPDPEVAAVLNRSLRTVRRLKSSGAVPTVQFGPRLRLIPRAAWQRLLQGHPPIPGEGQTAEPSTAPLEGETRQEPQMAP